MKIETQRKQVLKHLNKSSITSWEAIQKYKITRLSAIIHHLRKTHTIISEWKESNGKRFTEYKKIEQ